MEMIIEKIVRWLIGKFLKRHHLALNPPKGRRKVPNVVSNESLEATAGGDMDQWSHKEVPDVGTQLIR